VGNMGSIEDLLKLKNISMRKRDKGDIEVLKEMLRIKNERKK